jgi:hypothetical protein
VLQIHSEVFKQLERSFHLGFQANVVQLKILRIQSKCDSLSTENRLGKSVHFVSLFLMVQPTAGYPIRSGQSDVKNSLAGGKLSVEIALDILFVFPAKVALV